MRVTQISQLTHFIRAVKEDNRITTTHISLYVALFESWDRCNFQNPVCINRRTVMEVAKISGLATFHKCIRDLDEFGYIRYQPSRNPAVPSQVTFLKI